MTPHYPAIHPAPAPRNAAGYGPLRGTNPHEHWENSLTPQTPQPENAAGYESSDLQGLLYPADPHSLRERPHPCGAATPRSVEALAFEVVVGRDGSPRVGVRALAGVVSVHVRSRLGLGGVRAAYAHPSRGVDPCGARERQGIGNPLGVVA